VNRWGVRAATPGDAAAWVAMRVQLWPDGTTADHAADVRRYFAGARREISFLAFADGVTPVGFAEATIRVDNVNGTSSSPVGFLEGWYVAADWRGRGIGRALVAAVELWTSEQGCSELASDALLGNAASHRAHAACGFEETERVVCFRKRLMEPPA
jgi:aminoglycoside 6'-N-acetyltransferase I